MGLQEVFIRNLRFYRKQRKITQNELTLQIDMGLTYINGVEQGKYFPQPYVIERIADALGIKPARLFEDEGCPENIRAFNKEEYIEEITERLHRRLKADIRREIREVLGG